MPLFDVFSASLLLTSLLLAGATLLLLARESRWRGPALWWAIAHAWAFVTTVAYFAHLHGVAGGYAVSGFASTQFAASLLLGALPQRTRRTMAWLLGGAVAAWAFYTLLRAFGWIFDGALLLVNIVALLATARLLLRSPDFRSNSYGRWLAGLFILRAVHDLPLIWFVRNHHVPSGDFLVSALFAMANAVLMVMFVHRQQERLLRRLVRDLDLARRMAERAEHARNALLAGMSHELRTPLNAICGFAHLLENDDSLDAAKRRDYAHSVGQAGARLTRIVEELLELARVGDAGGKGRGRTAEDGGSAGEGAAFSVDLERLFREEWAPRFRIVRQGRGRLPRDVLALDPALLEHVLDRLDRLVRLHGRGRDRIVVSVADGRLRLTVSIPDAGGLERSLSDIISGRRDPYRADASPLDADLSVALVETCAHRMGGRLDIRREGRNVRLAVSVPLTAGVSSAA